MDDLQQPVVSGLELAAWRVNAKQAANSAGIPAEEVDWLLQEVADLDRLALRLELFKNKPQIKLKMPLAVLTQWWQQRVDAKVPVQYLTGVTPWRNFHLNVSPAVLIPRPETECLIDLAVKARESDKAKFKIKNPPAVGAGSDCNFNFQPIISKENPSVQQSTVNNPNPESKIGEHWVDLGTGSGAIAIGLADAFPEATIHAVDFSQDALAIATQNAQKLGFGSRIQFYQGFWWEPLAAWKGKLTGMISNPPYIPSSLVPQLQPEVAQHEPHLALDGGADGLDCIRYLVNTAPEYLQPGGIWLIEMMSGQAEAVTQLLEQQGNYCQIEIHQDFAGIKRFALAYIKSEP